MYKLDIEDVIELEDDMDDLVSAEDFLRYFDIPFDETVVNVNRLHILQRYHDYLSKTVLPEDLEARVDSYRSMLLKAYSDFVHSDAKTEKVLKVYKNLEPSQTFVTLDEIFK